MSGTIKPPDFDDMAKVSDEIRILTLKELSLKNEIKRLEADVVLEVTSNRAYFRDGKVPATNFIEATYKVTGLHGEITAIREELANVTSELEFKKRTFEILNGMLGAWQTESANMRKTTF